MISTTYMCFINSFTYNKHSNTQYINDSNTKSTRNNGRSCEVDSRASGAARSGYKNQHEPHQNLGRFQIGEIKMSDFAVLDVNNLNDGSYSVTFEIDDAFTQEILDILEVDNLTEDGLITFLEECVRSYVS